jgi:CubicO group peptidase (beta-lactamase class C family)
VVERLAATGIPEELARYGYDGRTWDRPWHLARGQLTASERMPSAELAPGGPAIDLPRGDELDVGSITFTDPLTSRKMSGSQFMDRRLYTDALAVLHRRKLVYETYRNGMTETDRHIAHSCSKTLTTMMVGIAIEEGMLHPAQSICEYVPELAGFSAWQPVTLQHVLDMATGIDFEEDYEQQDSMYWRYAYDVGYYAGASASSGTTLDFVSRELTRAGESPGRRFNYGSYLTNLLPIALANVYGVSAVELYEDRIYQHLGAERPAQINLDAAGNPIVEGQVNLSLRDFVRWGYPLVDSGRSLSGVQVIPQRWVDDTYAPSDACAAAFDRGAETEAVMAAGYHNQTWIIETGRVVSMLGIHGQFCWIDRTAQTMIVGFSSYPVQTHDLLSATLRELWSTIRVALDAGSG